MVAKADMAYLFAQPHENYSKNIEKLSLRNVRNQVEWKSDNYGIKPHPSRLVGGVETQNGLVSNPRVVDKDSGGIS